MALEPNYICTRCQQPTQRELLTVKKAIFQEIGVGGAVLKSRSTHWLCPSCVAKDPEWLLEGSSKSAPAYHDLPAKPLVDNGAA